MKPSWSKAKTSGNAHRPEEVGEHRIGARPVRRAAGADEQARPDELPEILGEAAEAP